LLTLVLLRDTRLEQTRKLTFLSAVIFVALNLLFGAAKPGIDNAAHLGGITCRGIASNRYFPIPSIAIVTHGNSASFRPLIKEDLTKRAG
jgi:membrane associated rhomboid family serine protease